jgi:chorismate--pyruvate lyase
MAAIIGKIPEYANQLLRWRTGPTPVVSDAPRRIRAGAFLPGFHAIMTRRAKARLPRRRTLLPIESPLPSAASPRWSSRPRPRAYPPGLADWLFDAGSLTRRLRRACPRRFQVRVLRQGRMRPSREEARALTLRPDAWTWIREVQLLCGDRPWVFARTLIPAATLNGRGRRLTQLGTRPLGEVLFADPGVCRGPVEVARIVAGQVLHQRAFSGFIEPPDAIWGRRSVFRIDGRPLLVCEIFLPDLPVFTAGQPPESPPS